MRFGWSTREAKLGMGKLSTKIKRIGDDKHSICLSLENECTIYHDNVFVNYEKSSIPYELLHSSQNVIGCLIDTVNRQFQFYINGHQVKSPDNVHFSTLPYYATVSLEKGQECQLNFGQAPFMFAPKDIRFSDFGETSENVEKYFIKTFRFDKWYWFAHPVIGNQVPLFYSDTQQEKCDELVRKLEHIEHNQKTQLDYSVECGRLVQSVIEVVDRRLFCDNSDLVFRWVKEKIRRESYFKETTLKLLELLYPYHLLSITSSNSIKSYNISTILVLLLFIYDEQHFSNFLVQKFSNLDMFLFECCPIEAFQLFLNPILFITYSQQIIYILKRLESFPLPKTKQALLSDPFLWWCSELFGQVSSVSRLYEPNYDLVRLQAGMYARWFCERVMKGEEQHFHSQSTLNPEDKTKHIKLSSDCLSARSDKDYNYGWQSVRSVHSVSSDIFYYEAVLLTNGKMRIGWATKQNNWDLNGTKWIGCDKYSIGFNGSFRYWIYHKENNFYGSPFKFYLFEEQLQPPPQWSVGDVVGCLIDCDKKIFQFYLNGKLLKCKEKIISKNIISEYSCEFLHFSTEPYHAAVSLQPKQQCYLNLGQCAFRHPPSVPFRTFHQVSIVHPIPTPLYSPRLSECYSLVQVLEKYRIELVFSYSEQKESDRLANECIDKISNNSNFQLNLQTETARLRLLQSFISGSKKKNLLDSCLSVHASWILQIIAESTCVNPAFPDLVAQLLYPYFTLHLADYTAVTHRNVCFVLVAMITTMDNLKARVNLYRQIFTYLTQIVIKYDQIPEEWMFLFALIGIGNLELHQNEVETLKSNAIFCKIIEDKQNLDLNDPHIFSINLNLPLMRQSVFISQWFCQNVLSQSPTTDSFSPNSSSCDSQTLNPASSSHHLKLSPDLLSARNDHSSIDRPFESVRSMSCVDSKRYYFEVTLVTRGQMRFGWASVDTDLTSGKLGDDEYSIGFDGYNRCVWHRGTSYLVSNVQRWNVRDVVGCMILAIENTFRFFLNGEPLNLPFRPYFSQTKPYHAAASLSTFQQCRFTFDHLQYPTKSPSFLLMNTLRRGSDSFCRSTINIYHSVLNNSIVNAGFIAARNINMRQISYSNSDSTINSLSSENASSSSVAAKLSFDEKDEDSLNEQNQ